jgi:phage terminase large subunit GpA-like protein
LQARAYQFAAQVPQGGLYLTAGIDMQTDRLEIEVVAWGDGEQSWSVDYRVLWGDPLAGDVWDDLNDVLAGGYLHESGRILPISAACLDTGGTNGYTQCAYEYLKGKTGRKLFGIKGVPGWGRPIVEKPQRKQSGKNARKIDLFLVGTDEAKLVVMRRFAVAEPGPGYCNFPIDRDAEWYKQATAEKLLTHYVKGQPVRTWDKPDKARNEALDCRVYALAALKIMQPSFKRLTEKLRPASAPAPIKPPIEAAPIEPTTEQAFQSTAETAVRIFKSIEAMREAAKTAGGAAPEMPIEAPTAPAEQTSPVFRSKRVFAATGKRKGNFAKKW